MQVGFPHQTNCSNLQLPIQAVKRSGGINHLGQWLTTGLFPMDNPRRRQLDEWTLGLPSLTSLSFQVKTSLPPAGTGDKEPFAVNFTEMIYHNNPQLFFFFMFANDTTILL